LTRFSGENHELTRLVHSFISQNGVVNDFYGVYYFSVKIVGSLIQSRYFSKGMPFHKTITKNSDIPASPDGYISNVSKNTLRAYILGNFKDGDKFIAFTFDPKLDFDQTNIDECNLKKNILVKRMKKYFPNAKYIIVPERHKDNRFHYHMITDLPYLTKANQQKLWSYGLTDVRSITYLSGCVSYLSKYLTKNNIDKTFKNRRKFYCSNTLAKTITLRGDEARDFMEQLRANYKPSFVSTYPIGAKELRVANSVDDLITPNIVTYEEFFIDDKNRSG
jgi:hypothetical protein